MREAINPDGFSEREIRDALETALHSHTLFALRASVVFSGSSWRVRWTAGTVS